MNEKDVRKLKKWLMGECRDILEEQNLVYGIQLSRVYKLEKKR